jgi:hypothetical protein
VAGDVTAVQREYMQRTISVKGFLLRRTKFGEALDFPFAVRRAATPFNPPLTAA